MKNLIIIFVFILQSIIYSQNEFLVNTFTDSTQRWPSVSKDGDGNYYVVWQSLNQVSSNSSYDIYFQQFSSSDNKVGKELRINDSFSGLQERPVIATNESGKSIVVWSSFTDFNSLYDIKGRILNKSSFDGNEFQINSTTTNTQSNPSVDINTNGDFVVVWDSWYQDGGDRGVYAQRFDVSGNKIGSEFAVNSTTAYSQAKPRVKYFSDDKFIVIWESFKQDGSGYGMYGCIFNSDGTPSTGEFQINSYTADYQWYGDIEIFDDNSFIVAWCSWEEDGDDGGIFVQRFNSNGSKIGDETQVNKTTAYYQWLPKIKKASGKNVAVVWSTWKQDGSREGIAAVLLDENNQRLTFETVVNSYTESFQWEPDFIMTSDDELLVVWSSWEQFGNDYDIVAKRTKLKKPQGAIDPAFYSHPIGTTTAKFVTHVMDSTVLTGDTYQITFQVPGSNDTVYAKIKDQNTDEIKVNNYAISNGVNTFYLTPTFDGCAVEFLPQFKLELDSKVYFVNNSGSNLQFSIVLPTSGQKILAPIDAALIWGSTDTAATGEYISPLDTALSTTGQKNVIVPFTALNLTNNSKLMLLVKELATSKNFKWDPKEEIVFLTPPPYQQNPFNTHAQINSDFSNGNLNLPNLGDTNFVLTKRPISEADTFYFKTDKSYIIADIKSEIISPVTVELFQNYPNPFNPTTTITFTIGSNQSNSVSQNRNSNLKPVTLKIYDILGREIATLINEEMTPGKHSIRFDSQSYQIASGVYFYRMISGDFQQSKKMILLR